MKIYDLMAEPNQLLKVLTSAADLLANVMHLLLMNGATIQSRTDPQTERESSARKEESKQQSIVDILLHEMKDDISSIEQQQVDNDAFAEEEIHSSWPPTFDASLANKMKQFLQYFRNQEQLRIESKGEHSVRWTVETVEMHSTIIWVMYLRFKCQLRGLKPTTVLDHDILRRLYQFFACMALSESPIESSKSPVVSHPNIEAFYFFFEISKKFFLSLFVFSSSVTSYSALISMAKVLNFSDWNSYDKVCVECHSKKFHHQLLLNL